MTILYKTVKSNLSNSEGNQNYYPKALTYNLIDNDQFVEMLLQNQHVSESAVRSVLAAINTQLMQLISNGHRVKIDGLGTFSLSVTGTPSLDDKQRIVFNDAHVDKIQFVPDASIKRQLKGVVCKPIDHEVYEPVKIDADGAEQIAREMLQAKPFFTSKEFNIKANVSYTKARTLLKPLVENGVLIVTGSRNSFCYMLAESK